tara:strand:- start:331 stop:543 length:213 start_codon:yes stop_codon:yes gene_type:complete
VPQNGVAAKEVLLIKVTAAIAAIASVKFFIIISFNGFDFFKVAFLFSSDSLVVDERVLMQLPCHKNAERP